MEMKDFRLILGLNKGTQLWIIGYDLDIKIPKRYVNTYGNIVELTKEETIYCIPVEDIERVIIE